MMGNIGAESAFNSHAAENVARSSWDNYVREIDTGAISKSDFVNFGWGFGLVQWTLAYRKNKLYDFAYTSNESIGDEYMQVQFVLYELTHESEYASLYSFLCETNDMYEATRRICLTYERPAVNNIETRFRIAVQCSQQVFDDEPDDFPEPPEPESPESCDVTVRVLRRGMKGRDVFILQTAISDIGRCCGVPDGDFGPKTETGVRDLQGICGLPVTGIVGQAEWQIIFQ